MKTNETVKPQIRIPDFVYRNLNSYKNSIIPKNVIKRYGKDNVEEFLIEEFKENVTIYKGSSGCWVAQMDYYYEAHKLN